MKEKRLQKIKDFERFYDNCESRFSNLRDNDKRVKNFEKEYMLNICPGSRAGGNEKRIVEVFWGARPYEFQTKGRQWKALKETGATLYFFRNDTGDVTIFLYPAKTEFRKPVEKLIALYQCLNPKKLNNEKFISSLWNDFIAYMECTSLDGKPTLSQRQRILYLRLFKQLIINNEWKPKKVTEISKIVAKWILTVGLSGIIIYLLTVMT